MLAVRDRMKLVECTLFDRTGGGAGLGTPAEELSGREHAQAGVRVDGVVQPLSTRPIVPALAMTVSSSTGGIRGPGVRFAFTR